MHVCKLLSSCFFFFFTLHAVHKATSPLLDVVVVCCPKKNIFGCLLESSQAAYSKKPTVRSIFQKVQFRTSRIQWIRRLRVNARQNHTSICAVSADICVNGPSVSQSLMPSSGWRGGAINHPRAENKHEGLYVSNVKDGYYVCVVSQ